MIEHGCYCELCEASRGLEGAPRERWPKRRVVMWAFLAGEYFQLGIQLLLRWHG